MRITLAVTPIRTTVRPIRTAVRAITGLVRTSRTLVQPITELVRAIRRLVQPITELIRAIRRLVQPITELVRAITTLVRTITELVPAITALVQTITGTTTLTQSVSALWKTSDFGDALYTARQTREPIAAFTDARPELGMEDGYAIQQHLVRQLLADDESIIGYKLGLTSRPMQEMLGISSPDLAPVMASHVHHDAFAIDTAKFIAPRMEGEIAFILGNFTMRADVLTLALTVPSSLYLLLAGGLGSLSTWLVEDAQKP